VLAHQQRQQQIDEATNANNTFYGSAHANLLGDEARQHEFDQANAQSALYDLLSQADEATRQAQLRSQDSFIGALPGAWERAYTMPGAGGVGDVSGGGDGSRGAGGGGTDQIPDTRSGQGGFGGGVRLPLTAPDYLTALALAKARGRAVAI
jgi:hypothetical protein